MKIDLHYGMDPSFGPDTHEREGVGGTENFITYSAAYLARAGHDVRVYNKVGRRTHVAHQPSGATWTWFPLELFDPEETRDILLSFRTREVFEGRPHARLKVIALADTESHGLGDAVWDGRIDLVMYVGRWQAQKISAEENIPPECGFITSNGVAMERFDQLRAEVDRVPGKCIHLATPERGLTPLLDLWPAIQAAVPHASLHLFSSFKGWRVNKDDNAQMCCDVYARIGQMQGAGLTIVNHQHAGAAAIRRHLLESQLYLYPTRHFDETCCISALEASAAGAPIVATARGALMERVRHEETGYLVGEHDLHDADFVERVIQLLKDDEAWRRFSANSAGMARRYDYARLVQDWTARWEQDLG